MVFINNYDTRILSAYYSFAEATILVAEIRDNVLYIITKHSQPNWSIKDFAKILNFWKCERDCNEHTILENLLDDFKYVNIESEVGNEKILR